MPSPVLSREEELYWLALKLVPGLGSRTSGKLLDRFRTPQAIFRASRTELEGAGVSGAIAQSIASGCTFEDAASQHEKMTQSGAAVVTIGDPRYPQPLREIFDPPMLLFARGRVELLQTITLGIVGTRRPTPYGLAVAERLSGDLAHAGLTISSGMARGIDTAAHKGALAHGGNTVAVLGCGVDVVYPVPGFPYIRSGSSFTTRPSRSRSPIPTPRASAEPRQARWANLVNRAPGMSPTTSPVGR